MQQDWKPTPPKKGPSPVPMIIAFVGSGAVAMALTLVVGLAMEITTFKVVWFALRSTIVAAGAGGGGIYLLRRGNKIGGGLMCALGVGAIVFPTVWWLATS